MNAPSPAQQSYMVILCEGYLSDGEPFWAYLQVAPTRARAFKEAQTRGVFNIEEYGEILEWGKGDRVPDDIRRRMEREHGVNHRMEADLLKASHKK